MKYCCYIFIFLFCFEKSYAQILPPNYFFNIYDNGGEDRITDFIEDSDNTFVCSGYTSSIGIGSEDVWLFKTDSTGNILWQKTFGDTLDDYCYSIRKCNNGGFVLAGSFQITGHPFPYLIKTDSAGNLQWEFKNPPSWGILLDVAELSNGDFFASGHTVSNTGSILGNYFLKLDANGNFIWEKYFNYGSVDGAGRIWLTPDGNIVVNSFTLGAASDFNILLCDTSGAILWNSYLSPTIHADSPFDLIYSPDDTTFIVCGIKNYSYPAYPSQGYILKINGSGDTVWTCSIPATEDYFLRSSSFNASSDIINFGDTYGTCGSTISSLLLTKISSDGNNIEVKYFCDSNHNWMASRIKKMQDGRLVIAGIRFLGSNANSMDGFLSEIKDDSVFTGMKTHMDNSPQNIYLFPNPTQGKIYLSSIQNNDQIELEITDLEGRLLFTEIKQALPMEIDLKENGIQSGLYFCILINSSGEKVVYKIIIN
jgi:hypothetical protein